MTYGALWANDAQNNLIGHPVDKFRSAALACPYQYKEIVISIRLTLIVMPKLVLKVDNPIVSIGNPVSGIVLLRLDKPTILDDVKIQFKGVSVTRLVAAGTDLNTLDGAGTDPLGPPMNIGSSKEKHTHVNIVLSLFHRPHGTELPAGEHVFPFIVNVPEFSQCGCPTRIRRYFDDFTLAQWQCERAASPSGFSNILLPPSMKRNPFRQIDYKLIAIADRPKFYNSNMSQTAYITVISAASVHAEDPSWNIPISKKVASRVYTHWAKSRKLPNSYFVPGALPKVSGPMKLISISTRITFVDVPAVLEIEIDKSNVLVFDKFRPRMYVTIQVDDMSRINGVLSLMLKSLIVTMTARDSGFANRRRFFSETSDILCDRTDISMLLEPLTISGPARFRIDDKVLRDGLDISRCVPDFRIMGLTHTHELRVAARISYNGGATNLMEASVPVVLQSGVDYDLDSDRILPPRYNFADSAFERQPNDAGNEGDFFGEE
ncbi:hypothetical protein V1525DRAFT_420447 [Lipomyces kononenkoae]|uniref:Uncharacterized protein n=1 Tax=Lipomyces kononenkoae TaxID=34357 RepID=A0ACC3SXJ2_LIPKO